MAFILIAATLAYLPSFSGRFLWNDSDYVTAPALRSLDGLWKIWSKVGSTQQYYPLLHSAFWLQHKLWGDEPLGYHVVTFLFHVGSAALFAFVLRRLLGRAGNSIFDVEWMAALIFAIHPVHVQSVAWITEQKNTLSLFFYLASIYVYLGFDETRRKGTYFLALLLFVIALACKTSTTSLPAALIVLLWWRRGNLTLRRDVAPLLPYLALGALAGLFSSWVERTYGGAHGKEFEFPMIERTLVAGRTVWWYARTLSWPNALNFIYPKWAPNRSDLWQWIYPAAAILVALALWGYRTRSRAPLTVFLLFAGSLFPVMGFVNLFGARYSWVWDHWQYLPDLGPIALIAAGLVAFQNLFAADSRWMSRVLVAGIMLLLGFLSWNRSRDFHDNITLYRNTIARNPGAWMAHNNLAIELQSSPGGVDEAIAEYRETLRLRPDSPETYHNLALLLSKKAAYYDEAIKCYRAALKLDPAFAEAHFNFANLLSSNPKSAVDAVTEYREAIRIKPDYVDAHLNLGVVYLGMHGRERDAIDQFKAVISIEPDNAQAQLNLGLVELQLPEMSAEAIAHLQEAIRSNPRLPKAHFDLGYALAQSPSRKGEAIEQFREELRLNPKDSITRYFLALELLEDPSKRQEAVSNLDEILRNDPNNLNARQLMNRLLK